jgi:transposase
MGTEQWQRD